MPAKTYSFILLPLALVTTSPGNAAGADEPESQQNSLCPATTGIKIEPLKPLEGLEEGATHLSADQATIDSESTTIFEGSAVARQNDRLISADLLRYDRNTEIFTAEGKLTYRDNEIIVTGERGEFNLQANEGFITKTNYFAINSKGRGAADKAVIVSKNEVALENSNYTTCPEGNVDWQLKADNITINTETQQGSASHVVLEFLDIPIFYLPYMRFPVGDARLSGFLYPGFSSSDELGTEIFIPYYWNIAPNMDATITPRYLSKRGTMLETEFRYLTQELGNGNFFLAHLPDDRVFKEERTKFVWTHQSSQDKGWSTEVNYNYVSDTQYPSTFGSSLGTTSITHLDRRGLIMYNADKYYVTTLFQDHQNISGDEPYKRLPQVQFNTRFANEINAFNYDLQSELVSFNHTDNSRVIGQRLYISPYISYPVRGDAGFIVPKLSVNHIQYQLDRTTLPTDTDNPGVTVPIFSIDSGLFLERDTNINGVDYLHTLEPRLFFVYAPEKDQSDIPVFDTGLTTFSETFLFSENRFSGKDRIGDTNQVTAAVTTRFYQQDTGVEVFNATVGQIFYFDDRYVTLPGDSSITDSRSNYIAVINLQPHTSWRLISDLQYNPETHHSEVGNTSVLYDNSDGTLYNLGYRFRRGEPGTEELRSYNIGFAWQMNPRWKFYGGYEFDVHNNRRLENFIGFRYDSCCWGIRLISRDRFDSVVGNEPLYEQAIYLEIELKGFSSIGQRKDINSLLDRGILGYSE